MPLGPYVKGQPFELQISTNEETALWSLWQKGPKEKRVPLGFWSRKLPNVNYTPFEKQRLACYWALVDTERWTGQDPVVLRPAIPIMTWVKDESASPRVGRAEQSSTVNWKWYIAERAKAGPQGVSALQEQVLAVTPTGEEMQDSSVVELEKSPVQEAPPDEQVSHNEVWFTDGSPGYQGNERAWHAAAINPRKQITLTHAGKGKSSQYAELMAMLMITEHAVEQKADAVYIYTDSWAAYKRLTVWFPKWKIGGFCIHNQPLWGQELRMPLDQMLLKLNVYAGHVDGHMSGTPEALYNQAANRPAKVRVVAPHQDQEMEEC
ncbi:Gag-Pol polyprotein [Varanus komodoensis]|nr:Gag-Pol polyprotein [Varanus komodoensis]